MSFGKFAIAVLKAVVCTIGFAIAVSLILSIHGAYNSDLNSVLVLAGAVFGLCVGICWAVERREVRIAFAVPTLLGLLVCLMMVSTRKPGIPPDIPFVQMYHSNGSYAFQVKVLLLGLLIGCVWALLRAGGFSTKQDQVTAPTVTDANVIEQIRELAALQSEGILTDDEFESKKQELLGRL